MLAMARVLVGAPRRLLIDEPTKDLAPKIVDEIFTLMDGLRRDGMGMATGGVEPPGSRA